MPSIYTVLGASGQVGKQASLVLLAAGHHVRVPLRNINSDAAKELKNAGATLVASGYVEGDVKLGSLSIDETVLTQAFTGVAGAFVLIPPNLHSAHPDEEADEFIELLKRAAEKSKIKKIVFLSSVGAHQATGNGCINKLHRLEEAFKPLAGPHFRAVFVRAGYFFSNLRYGLNATSNGTLPFPYDKRTLLNMLAPEDIGDEVAKHLLDDASQGSLVVELAGPQDVTFEQVTKMVSDILGKEIKYVQTLNNCVEICKSGGLSQIGAESVKDMVIGFTDGINAFEHQDKLVRGNRTLGEYLKANLKQ